MSEQDYLPDRAWVRESFDRAAARYDEAAVLQREVGERLLERLDLIRLKPVSILDVGAGTGVATRALMKRYPKARVTALDISTAMLKRARKRVSWPRRLPCVGGDAEQLPFRAGSFDMIFSNLTLQWCHDIDRLFPGWARCLRPEGLVMFSTLGPDTLTELRQSWAAVDERPHVNGFIDMHDIGDSLVRASFADPVMDIERFTLTYAQPLELMRDLKTIGAHNVNRGRPRGLTGRRGLAAMAAAYERFRLPDGRIPATYEVVYGHAWAPPDRAKKRNPFEAFVPVDKIGRRGGPGS